MQKLSCECNLYLTTIKNRCHAYPCTIKLSTIFCNISLFCLSVVRVESGHWCNLIPEYVIQSCIIQNSLSQIRYGTNKHHFRKLPHRLALVCYPACEMCIVELDPQQMIQGHCTDCALIPRCWYNDCFFKFSLEHHSIIRG